MPKFRFLYIVLGLVAILPLVAESQVNFKPMVAGSTYTMEETYDLAVDFPPYATGTVTLAANTNYNVVGVRPFTQGCPSIPGSSTTVFKVEYTGTLNVTGLVSINYPPVQLDNQAIRVKNGTYAGAFWVRESDLATVSKQRQISGSAEAEFFGQWLPLATLSATENEDYIPFLEDFEWPLDVGLPQRDAPTTVCLHGTYDADIPLIGQYQGNFDESIDFNFQITVPRIENIILSMSENYDTYVVDEFVPEWNAHQLFYYSTDARWFLRQELSGINLPGIGTLNLAQLNVKSFNIPTVDTPTPVGTATPTPTQGGDTPTPTPTQGGDTPTPTPTQGGDTPTPVPTNTPPSGGEPMILLGGYMGTDLDSLSGGTMTLMMMASDPTNSNDISEVELYYQSQPTGVTLPVTSQDQDFAVYTFTAPFGQTPPLQAALECVARHMNGSESRMWPYLVVR